MKPAAILFISVLLTVPVAAATIYVNPNPVVGPNDVLVEAEDYTTKTAGSGSAAGASWAEFAGDGSVGSYMQAVPDLGEGLNINSPDIESDSPCLNYQIDFPQAGTYYLWVRGKATDYYDDTVHYGLNGTAISSQLSDSPQLFYSGIFQWRSECQDLSRPVITIPSAGIHTLNIWMREDGARIDRLLLTKQNYIPISTIQAGINAATGGVGDIVIVAAGTYNENINFNGKNITLTSTDPDNPAVTIIQGDGTGSVVTFSGTEDSSCVLTGFTITGGGNTDYGGGGIFGNHNATAEVSKCIISGNSTNQYGGGIYAIDGLITNCIISDNTANRNGGGLANCDGTIINCIISGNSASIGGGGLYNCDDNITNCTIVGNTANLGGGIHWSSNATITNCIFWDNGADPIGSSSTPTYSCYPGGAGTNIDADPLFVAPSSDNYHLQAGSPCIDTGDPAYIFSPGETDVDSEPRVMGGRVDMGVDELTAALIPTIWLSSSQFDFSAGESRSNPASQILSIRNIGSDTLNWTISYSGCDWLTVSPTTGSSTGEVDNVTLSVDITGLVRGDYNCQLTISDPSALNNPQTVDVNLTVLGPIFDLSATAFNFSVSSGNPNPDEEILSISNIGGGTLDWTISYSGCDWLTASPLTGSSTGESDDVTLSVDASGLTDGTYNCQLTISDPFAENDPQTVSVTLEVTPIVLNYNANTYAYAFFGGSDTDQDSSVNTKCESAANGGGCYIVDYEEICVFSNVDVSVEGSFALNYANMVSRIHGWGSNVSSGGSEGGGAGNGNTLLEGTLEIGVFPRFPQSSSGPKLMVDATVTGDAPGSWEAFSWYFKIWDTDPNSPLAWLNSGNTSAELAVTAGETLNIKLYSEGQDYFPDGGRDTTVEVQLDFLIPNDADIDFDGIVDVNDFMILASQWQNVPGSPSADIAPIPFDNFVGVEDLVLIALNWLDGVPVPGLLALWKLNESAGGIAYDSSGNSEYGTLQGGCTWQPAGGHINGALQFDGNTDYLDVPNFYLSGSWTVALWVKCNVQTPGEPTGAMVFGNRDDDDNFFYMADGLRARFENSSGVNVEWTADTAFYDTWRHVGLVSNGTAVELYLDGVSQGSQTITPTFKFYHIGDGWTNSLYDFNGLLDDVRIYDYALDSSEIATLASQ